MLFDDIFYPGNPNRRDQIRILSLDINRSIINYQTAWNKLASEANPIFASVKDLSIFFETLTFDVDKDTVGECLRQINKVTKQASKQAKAIIESIDVGTLPEDWTGEIDYDPEKLHNIFNWLTSALAVGTGVLAGYGVASFIGLLRVFAPLLNVAGRFVTSSAGAIFATGIAGVVGFLVTDAIVSAISGAIERKKLRDAMEVLEKAKLEFGEPLATAALNINSVALQFQQGVVRIDEATVIIRESDGIWHVHNSGVSRLIPVKKAA
ncbi:MAG: hypothetical protein QMC38_01755 [Sinobacterium sp.]